MKLEIRCWKSRARFLHSGNFWAIFYFATIYICIWGYRDYHMLGFVKFALNRHSEKSQLKIAHHELKILFGRNSEYDNVKKIIRSTLLRVLHHKVDFYTQISFLRLFRSFVAFNSSTCNLCDNVFNRVDMAQRRIITKIKF